MHKLTTYLIIVILGSLALFASACAEQAPAPVPAPSPTPAPTPTPMPTPTPQPTPPRTPTPTPTPQPTPPRTPTPTPIPTPTPSIGEEANFRFLISDDVNAIGNFISVNVTISKIGVHSSGQSGNWTEFTPDITEVDLKPLVGENALEIWSGNLTAGEYNKVFIYVSNITGILTEDLGGEEANIKLPSNKLQISKPFVLSEDTVTSFVYDVTVVKAGKSGQYILKPQIAQSGADQEFKEVKKEEKGKDEEPETQVEEAAIDDTIWVLESYGDPDNLNDVLEDTEITIKFNSTSGEFEGSAGCNSYFGGYEIDEDKLTIKQPIGQTEMACLEPIMEQEAQYLTALKDVERYEIDGDQLKIFCGDKLLIYEKK